MGSSADDDEEHADMETGTTDQVVEPASAGLRIEWAAEPAVPQPGQPTTFSYRVIEADSNLSVMDLPLDHERPMHLILVSEDLTQFQHIHPELTADGSYQVETTLPEAGTYRLYDEFVFDGQTVLDERELTVGDAAPATAALTPDTAPKSVDGITVAVAVPETIQAGEVTHLAFEVTRDGQPVTDLEPYLGAAAHAAIVRADGSGFAHTHGEASVPATAAESDEHAGEEAHGGDHAVPTAFGPQVTVEYTFAEPGLYKLWIQFSHDGQVITAPFVVDVS